MQDQNTTEEITYPTKPDEKGYYFKSKEDQEAGNKSRYYPTPVDEEGFFYETEEEELIGVETKTYENEKQVKRVKLRKGKIALVREITGEELMEAKQVAGKNANKVEPAIAAYATKIDNVQVLMPELLAMGAKDYSLIVYASNALNFL